MPQSLYDLLPADVKAKFPPESFDAPAARLLLKPRVPDGYDPARAQAIGQALSGVLPKMTGMRTMTNRVRAAQRGQTAPPDSGTNPRLGIPDELDVEGERLADEQEAAASGPVESATEKLYRTIRPGVVGVGTQRGRELGLTNTVSVESQQLPIRAAAAAVQAAPNLSPLLPKAARYSTRDLVPPAKTAEEHVADLLGQTVGFGATATALGAMPGVSAAGAVGATGALQEGTLKERAIRGGTMLAAAGAGHALANGVMGTAPGLARAVAAHVPGAVAFGAAQPWAEEMIGRATGEKPKPFSGWDAGRGTLEMLVANLLMGAPGIAAAARRGPVIDVEATRIPRRPQRAPLDRQLTEGAIPPERQLAGPVDETAQLDSPRGRRPIITGNLPSSGRVYTPEANPQRLDRRALGPAGPVTLPDIRNVPPAMLDRARMIARDLRPPDGMSMQDAAASKRLSAAVNSVLAGKTVGLDLPGGPGKVAARVGQAFIYRTPSGEDVRLLVQDPSGSPVVLKFGSVHDMVAAVRPLAGERAAESRETVGATREAAVGSQTAEIDKRLAALQESKPAVSDKGYRRWAQRVERLTAERDALRARSFASPRPAPVAPAVPETATQLRAEEPAAVVGGGTVGEAATERGSGTAAPELKPLEQATLEGMPKPALPKGPKRSSNDNSADVIAAMGKTPEPTKQTDAFKTEETIPGTKAVATRIANAEDRFIDFAMEKGELTREQATAALEKYRKAKVVTIDPVGGNFSLKHGAFTERDVLRRAAGLEEPARASEARTGGETVEAPEGRRAYQPGEMVRVPYTGQATAFGRKITRATEKGEVVGYTDKGTIEVDVHRGKGVYRKTFTEEMLRRLPTVASRKAAQEARKAKRSRLEESIRKRAGGDAGKAFDIADEYENKARELQASIGGDMNHEDYPRVRRAWNEAMAAAGVAERVGNELSSVEGVPFKEGLPDAGDEQTHARRATPRGPTSAPPAKRGMRPPTAPASLPTDDEISGLGMASVPGGTLSAQPGPLKARTIKAILSGYEGLKGAMREGVALFNPLHLAPKEGLRALFQMKGGVDRLLFRMDRTWKDAREVFDKMSDGQIMDFLDNYQKGTPQDPTLQSIADELEKALQEGYNIIKQHKAGLPFIDNFFPQIWADPDKAMQVFPGRRPLEGTKSFLKHRVIPDIRAGLSKGLKLIDRNPVKLVQGYLHNIALFDAMQRFVTGPDATLKQLGLLKKYGLGAKPGRGGMPKDWARPEGSYASIFLNPVTEVLEYHDKAVKEGLERAARDIGARYMRKAKLRMRGALGLSMARPGSAGEIETRYFTPMSVLAHELGHAIHSKYHVEADRRFLRRSTTIQTEMRNLADLRWEGTNPPAWFKQYVRKAPEKMAVMLEAFIHMPQRFKETAPHLYDEYRDFLGSHADTKSLLDVKPSLMEAHSPAEIRAGGAVLGGAYWMQKDLARLLDNYMSRDAIRDSFAGRGMMWTRNKLNAMQLGLSAFHLSNITFISTVNRASVALSKLASGDASGLKLALRAPLAPLDYLKLGRRFFDLDPSLRRLEEDIFEGGGARMHHLATEETSFDKVIRWRRNRALPVNPADFPMAGIEATTRIIMAAVERMKVGAFHEVFSQQLQERANEIGRGDVTREEVARLAWRDVEDRLGKINYDNLFWNNMLKSAIMLMVRAPGWTLGSYRTLGGATFVDMPRFAAKALAGRLPAGVRARLPEALQNPPRFTPRMSYALMFLMLHMGLGAAWHMLATGKRPETLQDYLHPKNGLKNADGTDQRVTFPTDLRTAESVTHNVSRVLGREKGAGTDLMWSLATGPLPQMMRQFIDNQTYRGPLTNAKDPWYEQAGDVLKWLFGTLLPISIAGSNTGKPGKVSVAQRIQQFMGITQKREPKPKGGRGAYRRAG